MKEKEKEIGELFLENFVGAILYTIQEQEGIKPIPEKQPKQLTTLAPMPIQTAPRTIPGPIKPMRRPLNPLMDQRIVTKQTVPSQMIASPLIQTNNAAPSQNTRSPRLMTVGQPVKLETQKPLVIEQSQIPSSPRNPQLIPGPTMDPLGRISGYIKNPRISSIECSGPGKNIIINKDGRIQTIPIRFSEEEIEDIMDHFSQRARIPLIQGGFKAAIDNFIITAVISEIAGTRFHIEKMNQFRPGY